MSPPRLHVHQPLAENASLLLEDGAARYIGRVLRLRPGDDLVVFDGRGGEFPAVIEAIDKQGVKLAVGPHANIDIESPLAVHLLQGLCRGERMDLVVQKATELGVQSITPLVTERTVVKLVKKRAEKRVDHWRSIAISASEQCGRNILPKIAEPVAFRTWLGQHAGDTGKRVNLVPGAVAGVKALSLKSKEITLLVGPEGGLSDVENELADSVGFERIGFGPRILRTETAAIAVLSALQCLYGDLH